MQTLDLILLILQSILFVIGRLFDDMSWYDVGVKDQVKVFQGIGIASMTLCAIIKIFRKRKVQDIWCLLFYKSQLKFIIPWSLCILIVILFFNTFGCKHQHLQDYFFVDYDGCCINATQLMLTNLNYSFLCNTKADYAELFIVQFTLFVEVIYNGTLLLGFIQHMQGKQKDYSILFVSIVIANQILIMDLLFRAAYEDKERQQQEQHRLKALSQTDIPQSHIQVASHK